MPDVLPIPCVKERSEVLNAPKVVHVNKNSIDPDCSQKDLLAGNFDVYFFDVTTIVDCQTC